MKLSQILDRPIAYHRCFVTLTGSVKAAIMLSQAVYWQPRAKQADGWWYKSADEWQEETGLTRHEQATARKECEKYLKAELRGIPATLYWKVDESAIMADLFGETSESSLPESAKLDLRKQSNINKNTETTTENNTEINPEKKPAVKNLDPIDHALDFARMKAPSAELSLAIESAVKVQLGLEATSTKGGIEFVNHAVKQTQAGENYQVFLDWWKKNFPDRKFWSFPKMRENWPAAFMDDKKAIVTSGVFYG